MKKIRKMSRMRKLLVSMVTLMFGAMMFTTLQSNVNFDKGGNKYEKEYQKRVVVKKMIPNNVNLKDFKDFNLIGLKDVEYTKKVNFILDERDNLTIKTEYLDTKKMLADWQIETPISIISNEGIDIIDKNGKVVSNLEHSEIALESHFALTEQLMYKKELGASTVFNKPNKEEISAFLNFNVNFTENKDGSFSFEDENFLQFIDPKNLTTTLIVKNKEGADINTRSIYINDRGIIRLLTKETVSDKVMSNGFNYKEIRTETYSNYYETINN